jgi:uncharacterized protein
MRFLYLHGFASGPNSSKAVALARHFESRGRKLERLDLRIPSLERLRLSSIINRVRAEISGPTILIGSSLGGLTAARINDPRVEKLILLAPAFRLIERWRRWLGEEAWRRWEKSGWLAIEDYVEKKPARIDFAFTEDVERADPDWPEVRVPTLILHGKRDETVDIELSREFAQHRSNVELIELDDDHSLLKSLDRIAQEIDRFL